MSDTVIIMDMSNKIKEYRQFRNLSMEALGNLVGTTPSTISKIEKGIMRLSDRWMAPIAEALGVSMADLLDESETEIPASDPIRNPPIRKRIPVYGLAAGAIAGGARILSEDAIEYVQAQRGVENVRDAYALIVTGTSMQPRFEPGDIIFINPHRPYRGGDYVVIQEETANGIAVSIKRFVKADVDHIVTEQFNPPAEIKFLRKQVTACQRVLTSNELIGA